MLYIDSLNAARATPVMDTIIQRFTSGEDIRSVWIEAAKMADLVNVDITDGISPSSRCDCDAKMARSELHACEGCTGPTTCATRALAFVQRKVYP